MSDKTGNKQTLYGGEDRASFDFHTGRPHPKTARRTVYTQPPAPTLPAALDKSARGVPPYTTMPTRAECKGLSPTQSSDYTSISALLSTSHGGGPQHESETRLDRIDAAVLGLNRNGTSKQSDSHGHPLCDHHEHTTRGLLPASRRLYSLDPAALATPSSISQTTQKERRFARFLISNGRTWAPSNTRRGFHRSCTRNRPLGPSSQRSRAKGPPEECIIDSGVSISWAAQSSDKWPLPPSRHGENYQKRHAQVENNGCNNDRRLP